MKRESVVHILYNTENLHYARCTHILFLPHFLSWLNIEHSPMHEHTHALTREDDDTKNESVVMRKNEK